MVGKKKEPVTSKKKGKAYGVSNKRSTPRHEKEYIGESKNKEYAKQKVEGKVYVFAIDKKTGSEKRMTYQAYQKYKKTTNIYFPTRLLYEAKEATNKEFGKRIWYKANDDNIYEYKKFLKTGSDGKKKVYFLELVSNDEVKNQPVRLLTFNQAKGQFIKHQKVRALKTLEQMGYDKKGAEKKYKENQKNLYETRLKHIQEHKQTDRKGAISYYKSLVKKGDFYTLKAYNYDGWKKLDKIKA